MNAESIVDRVRTNVLFNYKGEFENVQPQKCFDCLKTESAAVAFRMSFWGKAVYVIVLLFTLGLAKIVFSLYFLTANRNSAHIDYYQGRIFDAIRAEMATGRAQELIPADPDRTHRPARRFSNKTIGPANDKMPAPAPVMEIDANSAAGNSIGGPAQVAPRNQGQVSGGPPPPTNPIQASAPASPNPVQTSGNLPPNPNAFAAVAGSGSPTTSGAPPTVPTGTASPTSSANAAAAQPLGAGGTQTPTPQNSAQATANPPNSGVGGSQQPIVGGVAQPAPAAIVSPQPPAVAGSGSPPASGAPPIVPPGPVSPPSIPAGTALPTSSANATSAQSLGTGDTAQNPAAHSATKSDQVAISRSPWPFRTTCNWCDPYHRAECQPLYDRFVAEYEHSIGDESWQIPPTGDICAFDQLIAADDAPTGRKCFSFCDNRIRGAIISATGKLQKCPDDIYVQKILRALLHLYYNIDSIRTCALGSDDHSDLCPTRANAAMTCAFTLDPFAAMPCRLPHVAPIVDWILRNRPAAMLRYFRCAANKLIGGETLSALKRSGHVLIKDLFLDILPHHGKFHDRCEARNLKFASAENDIIYQNPCCAVMSIAAAGLFMQAVCSGSATATFSACVDSLIAKHAPALLQKIPRLSFADNRTVDGATYTPFTAAPMADAAIRREFPKKINRESHLDFVRLVCGALAISPGWRNKLEELHNGDLLAYLPEKPGGGLATQELSHGKPTTTTSDLPFAEIAEMLSSIAASAKDTESGFSQPFANVVGHMINSLEIGMPLHERGRSISAKTKTVSGETAGAFVGALRSAIGEIVTEEKELMGQFQTALACSGNGTIYKVEIRPVDGSASGGGIVVLVKGKRYTIEPDGAAAKFFEIWSGRPKTPVDDDDPIREICDGNTTLFFYS
jgi:hypothetical protein